MTLIHNRSMQNSDYIAIGSAVISLLAMFNTIWQALLTRKHNRLCVRPLLIKHIDRQSTPCGAEVILSVKNKGIGPALITDGYFTVHGQRFRPSQTQTDEVRKLVESVLGQNYRYEVKRWGLPGKGAAIHPQDETIVVQLSFPAMSHENLSAVIASLEHVAFILDYESLYGQRFTL